MRDRGIIHTTEGRHPPLRINTMSQSLIVSEFIGFSLTAALWTFQKHFVLPPSPPAQPRGKTAPKSNMKEAAPKKTPQKRQRSESFSSGGAYLDSIAAPLLHIFLQVMVYPTPPHLPPQHPPLFWGGQFKSYPVIRCRFNVAEMSEGKSFVGGVPTAAIGI